MESDRTEPARQRLIAAGWLLLSVVVSVLVLHHGVLASGLRELHGDPGDTRFNAYLLEHSWAFLTRQTPSFFDAPFFAPAKNVLSYSDLMVGSGFLYWPWRAVGVDRDAAFALFCVGCTVLDAAVFFLLLHRGLQRSAIAAAFGAVLFAAGLPRSNFANHPQLLPLFFPALALWAAVALYRSRSPRGFAVLAGALTLQLYTAFYTAWFTGFLLGLCAVIALLLRGTRAETIAVFRRGWPWMLGSFAVAFVLLLPLGSHYLRAARELGTRDWSAILLPRIQSFLHVGDNSVLYGFTAAWSTFQQLPVEGEQRVGVGLLTTCVLLFVLFRHRSNAGMKALAITTLVAVMLTVKWRGGVEPWHLVFKVVPGANAIRALPRIGIFLLVPAAIALATLIDEPRRRLLGIAVALLCLTEQLSHGATFDAETSRRHVEQLAARVPPRCPAFAALSRGSPRPSFELQLDAMWAAYDLRMPTVNGYSGNVPRGYGLEALDRPDAREQLAQWARTRDLPLPTECILEVTE